MFYVAHIVAENETDHKKVWECLQQALAEVNNPVKLVAEGIWPQKEDGDGNQG